MKALSTIAMFIAAFFIFLGFVTKESSGILSNAIIIGGVLIAILVITIWVIMFVKEKKEAKFNDSDSK